MYSQLGKYACIIYLLFLVCSGAKTRLKVRVTLSVAVNHRVTILNFLISSLLPLVLAWKKESADSRIVELYLASRLDYKAI